MKVGELVDSLRRTRMLDDAVIVFCADHGDMLGERGLWFKMNFFEGSARVPLMIAGPGVPAGTHRAPVSNLDLNPTLCDLAGIADGRQSLPGSDGESLSANLSAALAASPVLMEYAAEGSYAPLVGITRRRPGSTCAARLDLDQLFQPGKGSERADQSRGRSGSCRHAVEVPRGGG
jgi:choline-sulfatase